MINNASLQLKVVEIEKKIRPKNVAGSSLFRFQYVYVLSIG